MPGLALPILAAMSLQANAACAGGTDDAVCTWRIQNAWQAGQAAPAGRMAAALLEGVFEAEEQLGREGAALAFIAAIGALMEYRVEESSYWFWVARQHENACGELPDEFHVVVTEREYELGSSRTGDRRIITSPVYAARNRPCRETSGIELDLETPRAPDSPAALIIFSDREIARRAFSYSSPHLSRVPMEFVYEYPRGAYTDRQGSAMNPATDAARSQIWQQVLVLAPCRQVADRRAVNANEICRADVPAQ